MEQAGHRAVAIFEDVVVFFAAGVNAHLLTECECLLGEDLGESAAVFSGFDHCPLGEFEAELIGILCFQGIILCVPHIVRDDLSQGIANYRSNIAIHDLEALVELVHQIEFQRPDSD